MKYNKFGSVLCVLTAFAAISCETYDESRQHFDNRVFVTATNFANEVRIEKNIETISRAVTIGIAKPEAYDISATFEAAPQLLDTYRLAYYDAQAVLLPEKHYDLSQAGAQIKKGKIVSDPLVLDFVNLEQLDLDKHYVLPVTIASVNGVGVLKGAGTLYYVFKEASLVNVVADIKENKLWPEWTDPTPVTDMETFTLEALVLGYAFNNASSISTIMGIEDLFLIRVGDTTIPKNQLQIAYAQKTDDGSVDRGGLTDQSLKLQTNRWYHVAVSFDRGEINVFVDGKLKISGNSAPMLTSVDFGVPHSDEADGKPRCFWIGYSYDDDRSLNGQISEVRIWNKALTEEQIAAENHFYQVDPQSEGLIAYWKFDDAVGKIVKDHTRYGNDLTADNNLRWVPVELPKKKEI